MSFFLEKHFLIIICFITIIAFIIVGALLLFNIVTDAVFTAVFCSTFVFIFSQLVTEKIIKPLTKFKEIKGKIFYCIEEYRIKIYKDINKCINTTSKSNNKNNFDPSIIPKELNLNGIDKFRYYESINFFTKEGSKKYILSTLTDKFGSISFELSGLLAVHPLVCNKCKNDKIVTLLIELSESIFKFYRFYIGDFDLVKNNYKNKDDFKKAENEEFLKLTYEIDSNIDEIQKLLN